MAPITVPAFLVEASSYSQARRKVQSFLENTVLVKYDSITFSRDRSCSALDEPFWKMIENNLEKNQRSMAGLIQELEESGYHRLAELGDMQQGYESKLLHTLVHLLDGFIGVDSRFYNLIEDSHRISASLCQRIRQDPTAYWLLQVETKNLRDLIG